VLMPVADLATIGALAREALRGLDPDAVDLVPAPRRARWRAPLSARWAAIGSTEELVVSRRGLVTRRLDAVPTTRVQSLALVQGPWSRRLGLADLEVHSPVGRVGVLGRFRAQGEARELLGELVTRTRQARRAAALR
jgi:putative membrane protein